MGRVVSLPPIISYLVDTSAYYRGARAPEVAAALASRQGRVARCGILELETLFQARDYATILQIRKALAALPLVETTQQDFDRAADVMTELAGRHHHRAAKLPDLILAAVAERARLTILHYDHDFDLIAKVTGQSTEWVVPSGSAS